MSAQGPEFTFVVTCYFEEDSIDEFHDRLSAAARATGRSHEIVFVNDGSTDHTFERLKAIYDKNPSVTCIIDLFRNAGQGCAITAALCEARGRNFVFLDSDLQLAPEQIPELLAKFDEGYDIVSGTRTTRRDPWRRVLVSKVANWIMRRASRSQIRDFGCNFKVFNGKLVRAFELGPHKAFNQVEIIAQAGRVAEIAVSHHERRYGKSGWTLMKLLDFNMENVVNLTSRPFQYIILGNLFLAALFVLRIVSGYWITWRLLPQITTGLLLNFMLILFFVEIMVLAALGEVGIRSLRLLQKNPRYVIRKMYKKG